MNLVVEYWKRFVKDVVQVLYFHVILFHYFLSFLALLDFPLVPVDCDYFKLQF